MTRNRSLLVLIILLVFITTPAHAKSKTLDIYFIDVEGGAATLIVTPLGESLLIDSGFPEQRDAQRILHVARDVARLRQIDHYITTHWHRDHVGGIPLLAKLISVKRFYDHGLPSAAAPDIAPGQIELYRQIVHDSSVTLKAGDEITLRNGKSPLPLRIRVMASNATVVGEQPGAPQIKPCGTDFKPIPEDKTDNANSLGFLLSYGDFQFFNGGDLTWNVENKLACPENLVGAVDLFQVNHHGAGNSNNPALVHALQPRVAVIDNGAHKGAAASTFATLKSTPAIEAIYQLHRNLGTTDKDNAPADYVANDEAACQGEYIRVSVGANTKTYAVSIPGKKIRRTYQSR
jgi:competence protein ComEC